MITQKVNIIGILILLMATGLTLGCGSRNTEKVEYLVVEAYKEREIIQGLERDGAESMPNILQDYLNGMASDGWVMVSISEGLIFFKRTKGASDGKSQQDNPVVPTDVVPDL